MNSFGPDSPCTVRRKASAAGFESLGGTTTPFSPVDEFVLNDESSTRITGGSVVGAKAKVNPPRPELVVALCIYCQRTIPNLGRQTSYVAKPKAFETFSHQQIGRVAHPVYKHWIVFLNDGLVQRMMALQLNGQILA